MAAIEIEKVTKKFKNLTAVDQVDLEINEGECFGLLGPNGAGKTSLIRMIIGASPITFGEIRVLGKNLKTDARQIKAWLGVVPQMDNLDPDLTTLQNLLVFARYFDIPGKEARRRSLETLDLFELRNKADSSPRELSGGMKRRLLLARGLINLPRLLILDEPTVGLDPQSKYLVWNKLTDLKHQGITQLLCTQNMDEAAALCDRVAIMNQGKILSLDTPERLIRTYVGAEVGEVAVDINEKAAVIADLKRRGYEIDDAGPKINIFHIHGAELGDLRIRRRAGTLEDVFFRLTGRSLGE